MSNPKNALQELLARHQGTLGPANIVYTDTQDNLGFSSTVTVTFTLQGASKVLSRSSFTSHVTKKEAQFRAASIMIRDEELNNLVGHVGVRANSNHTLAPANSIAGPNNKMILNELSTKAGVSVRYDTSEKSPFTSVLNIPHPKSSWEVTSVTGQPASTKREAEQSAAGLALTSPQVMALFGLAVPSQDAPSPSSASPEPPATSPTAAFPTLTEDAMAIIDSPAQLSSTAASLQAMPLAAGPVTGAADDANSSRASASELPTPVCSTPGSVSTLTMASAVDLAGANPKGKLLELVSQAGLQRSIIEFDTTPTAPFVSTLRVGIPSAAGQGGEVVLLTGHGARVKKEAEQTVAAQALEDPRIRQLLRLDPQPAPAPTQQALSFVAAPTPTTRSQQEEPTVTPVPKMSPMAPSVSMAAQAVPVGPSSPSHAVAPQEPSPRLDALAASLPPPLIVARGRGAGTSDAMSPISIDTGSPAEPTPTATATDSLLARTDTVDANTLLQSSAPSGCSSAQQPAPAVLVPPSMPDLVSGAFTDQAPRAEVTTPAGAAAPASSITPPVTVLDQTGPSKDVSTPSSARPEPFALSSAVTSPILAGSGMAQAGVQEQLPSTVTSPLTENPAAAPVAGTAEDTNLRGVSTTQPPTPQSTSPSSASTLPGISAAASAAAASPANTAPQRPLSGVPSMSGRAQGGVTGDNPKGQLIQRFTQTGLQHIVPKFETTPVAPFVSTVTVVVPSGAGQGGEVVALRGPAAPNKKAAEQAVAAMALEDPRIRQVLRLPALSPTPTQLPQSFAVTPSPAAQSQQEKPTVNPVPKMFPMAPSVSTVAQVAPDGPSVSPPVTPQKPSPRLDALAAPLSPSLIVARGRGADAMSPISIDTGSPAQPPLTATATDSQLARVDTVGAGTLLQSSALTGCSSAQQPAPAVPAAVAPSSRSCPASGAPTDQAPLAEVTTPDEAAAPASSITPPVTMFDQTFSSKDAPTLVSGSTKTPLARITATAAAATSPPPAADVDYKGKLWEYCMKLNNIMMCEWEFKTSEQSPFHCTFELSAAGICMTGPSRPTKKAAEQAVAKLVLEDARARQVLRVLPAPASSPRIVAATLSAGGAVRAAGINGLMGPASNKVTAPGVQGRSGTSGATSNLQTPPAIVTVVEAPVQAAASEQMSTAESTPTSMDSPVFGPVVADSPFSPFPAVACSLEAARNGTSPERTPPGPATAVQHHALAQERVAPIPAAATATLGSQAETAVNVGAAAPTSIAATASVVACLSCRGMLGDAAHFFVYLKSETEIQLVVKPEVAAKVFGCMPAVASADGLSGTISTPSLPALRRQPQHSSDSVASDIGSAATSEDGSFSPKHAKERISCGHCSFGVGVKLNTGPNNGAVYSCGANKVTVNDTAIQSWSQALDSGVLDAFERRDGDTFYGASVAKPKRAQNTQSVRFPRCEDGRSCEESSDFGYVDLLSPSCIAAEKRPKPEQLRAFHLALQDNLIVVFPTGFGKTFVASLVMHRFRKLNPSKLVVMVVDRVPLVQQQSEAIHKDTGMIVCPLSGENNTPKVVNNVVRGVYEALVVTAGALCDIMALNKLYITDFSAIVLDECHHVTGGHKYTELLSDIAKCPIVVRPRVVGLTASPFNIRTTNETSAADKLAELREAFFAAQVYRPPGIGSAFHSVHVAGVQRSQEQRAEQDRLTSLLAPKVQLLLDIFQTHKPEQYNTLCKSCKVPNTLTESEHKRFWHAIENLASVNHHLPSDPPELVTTAKAVRMGVYDLEANFLLGPAFSQENQRAEREDDDTVSELSYDGSRADYPNSQLSSQLLQLCHLLQTYTASKTLVFVSTRYTAETLHRFLLQRFPELNCAKLIGQGGSDGMKWRGLEGQGAVLQRFREGATKLIVCTSVLEEGLDVKDCDLVIRFGGAPSLIQLVQSKGRARAESGRLVLICTTEEQKHFEELKTKEQIVDRVLTNSAALAGAPTSGHFEEFVRRSTEQLQDLALRDPVERDADESGDEGEESLSASERPKVSTYGEAADREARSGECGYPLTLIVQARAGTRPSQDDIERGVPISLLSLPGTVQDVDRLRQVAQQSSMDPRAVSSRDTMVVTSVISKCDDFWWRFCAMWDFTVRGFPTFLLSPFPTMKKEDSGAVTTTRPESAFTEVASVAAGHLIGPQQFLPAGTLGAADGAAGHKYDRLVVHHGKRLCIESTSSTGEVVSIALSAAILGRSALACAQGGAAGTFTIYFTMSSVPAVYQCSANQRRSSSEGGMSQYRVFSLESLTPGGSNADLSETPAQHDLRLLAHCAVIAVTFPAVKWRRVLRKLTDPAVLGLNVLITRVVTLKDSPDPGPDLPKSEMNEAEVSVQNDADSADLRAARRKCLWAYATLSADVHTLALNPVTLPLIKSAVSGRLQSSDAAAIRECTQAIQSLHSLLQQGTHWLDAAALFTSLLPSTPENSSVDSTTVDANEGALTPTSDFVPPEARADEYAYVKHVTVTPSRVIIQPATLTKTNRLIRMYGQRHVLVYARFRDEQGQPIYAKHIFEHRYQRMFTAGLDIAGRHYEFLLCSASQLREATAVFLEGSYDEVQAIRSTLVSADLGSIPKQLTRMGLFCTADSDTGVQLRDGDNMVVEPDLYCCDGQGKRRILTDGSGRMTPAFARQVQQDFFQQHGYFGTLIQIRALGCKGTLLCDPALHSSHPGKDVVFRASMKKFDTDCHTTLCLVKVTDFCPLTLNRESITLLCALRDRVSETQRQWSPHNTLVALQDEALDRLGQMLVNPTHAIDRLSAILPRKDLQSLLESGGNVLTEPHFMALLHLMYAHDSRRLRQKTHIPVHHAALAMGAPDPTGLLRDGEVFLCVHRPVHGYAGCFEEATGVYKLGSVTLIRVPNEDDADSGTTAQGYETFVVTGRVVIHRNPCLDPGDMRIVTAVDRPQLRYWKNVLLLPAASHCQRSLSAECSGGDLDGDTFSTIWHPQLIAPESLQFDAVDYEAIVEKAEAKNLEGGTKKDRNASASEGPERKREEIAGFISRTMCNACLGRIAHLHLALCDQLRGRGAGAPLARKVAEAQSLAVDYPKTGIPPDVPDEAKKQVRQKGYPHFMEKPDRDQYDSIETLGTLYNVSSTVTCMAGFTSQDAGSAIDTSYVFPGQEEYRSDAERTYLAFEKEMQGLMLQYKLQSEAEVVLGVPYQWAEEFTLDHLSAANSLAASWKRLRSHYRALFYNTLSVEDPASALKKAAAWYHVAYKKDRLRSFAWLVHEELLKVRAGNVNTSSAIESAMLSVGGWVVHPSVATSVGASAKQYWQGNAKDMLRYVELKRAVFQRVKAAILRSKELLATGRSDTVRIELYGSVSMLLCEAHSDLDIFISMPDITEHYLLQDIVAPAMGDVAEQVKYIKDAKPRLVKLRMEDDYEGTDVDITAKNRDGVYKSCLIRHFYSQSGACTVLFSSIVQWARCCGLLRGETTANQPGPLNSGQVQALVVNFLTATDKVQVPSEEVLLSFAASDGVLERQARHSDELNIGHLLLRFFAFYWTFGAGAATPPPAPTVVDAGSTDSPVTAADAVPSEVTFHYRWPVPGNPEHSIAAPAFEELRDCCRRALHVLARSRDWSYLLEHARAFEKERTRLETTLSTLVSRAIRHSYLFIATTLAIETKARVTIVPSPADTTRLQVSATGRPQQILALRRAIARLIYQGRIVSFGAIRSLSSAYFMENSSLLCARGVDTRNALLHIDPVHLERSFVRVQHAFTEMSALSLDDAYRCDEDAWRAAFFAAMRERVKQQVAQITSLRRGDRLQFSVHLGKFLLLDAARSFERARDAVSCAEIETAINSNRGNAKFEMYEHEADSQEGAASRNGAPASRGQEGGSRSSRSLTGPVAQKQNRKRSLATTFVSSLPLQAAPGPANGGRNASDKAVDLTIQEAEDKLATILAGLGYADHEIQPNPAISSGAVPVSSSSTLQIPTNTWRVAVELSQHKQMHVDIDSDGQVVEVEERLVSWVSGTLLAAAAPAKPADGAAADDQAPEHQQPPEGWGSYDFREHDLRFKLGTTRHISPTEDAKLYEQVCAAGQAPVQFETLGAEPEHPDVSVNSQLPSGIAQHQHVSSMDTPVVVSKNQLLQNGDVSFARRVIRRRAFLSPTAVIGAGDSQLSGAAASSAGCPVPIYAMVAVGQHYDGSKLEVLNPFLDVSLEIDVSTLKRIIRSAGRLCGEDSQDSEDGAVCGDQTECSVSDGGDTGDSSDTIGTGEDSVSLSDSEALDAYIGDVLSEVLRVSDAIRAKW